MSQYGETFDRIASEWRTIENAHDREHPDRDQCGGVGGCTMMRVAHGLEQNMMDALEDWRKGASDPGVDYRADSDRLAGLIGRLVRLADEWEKGPNSAYRLAASKIRQELER